MPSTHRLFSIIQTLRSARRPITAEQLASELEVSQRTIYRDIFELQTQHVPIEGEAGVGYVLRDGYELPPLMLTANELEAAVLGAHWVTQRGDAALAEGAKNLIAKLESVIPQHLKPVIEPPAVSAPSLQPTAKDAIDVSMLRQAIRLRQKVHINYCDGQEQQSQRIIWPFMIAYFETARLVVAWCEQRAGFRHFRSDRIRSLTVREDRFPISIEDLKFQWWEEEKQKSPPGFEKTIE